MTWPQPGPLARMFQPMAAHVEQRETQLKQQLEEFHVIVGGHSAGGRVAIESASPEFSPQFAPPLPTVPTPPG